jgi:uncharacterized protein YqhQ
MSKRNSECIKRTSIGGQALIEGIMMRGPKKTVMSVRLPDGGIGTEQLSVSSVKDKYKILSLPVIRGVVGFVESMVFGYKALMLSAERSGMLDEEEEKKPDSAGESAAETSVAPEEEPAAETDAKTTEQKSETSDPETTEQIFAEASDQNAEQPTEDPSPVQETVCENTDDTDAEASAEPSDETAQELAETSAAEPEVAPKTDNGTGQDKKKGESGILMAVIGVASMVLGIGLAVVLFMLLPTLAFNQLNKLANDGLTLYRALFEGVVKIIIFVVYLALVSMMKDIKRVFKYHGAEHKTIFCYEMGLPLTVENVRKQQRFHPRCGTSFLILMLLVSILIYALLSIFVPVLTQNAAVWVGLKLLILPVICGIGYELIKFCGRHDNLLTSIISAPGMWLQRITTKEPDDSMIEVAIAAMTEVIPDNGEDDKW